MCLFELCPNPASRAPTALARNGDHLIPVVDQLVELDLPLLKRERLEPVISEEGPDLVIAAMNAKSGNAARGKSHTSSGDQKPSDDRFRSTAVNASNARRTSSTFSSDIAHGIPRKPPLHAAALLECVLPTTALSRLTRVRRTALHRTSTCRPV